MLAEKTVNLSQTVQTCSVQQPLKNTPPYSQHSKERKKKGRKNCRGNPQKSVIYILIIKIVLFHTIIKKRKADSTKDVWCLHQQYMFILLYIFFLAWFQSWSNTLIQTSSCHWSGTGRQWCSSRHADALYDLKHS